MKAKNGTQYSPYCSAGNLPAIQISFANWQIRKYHNERPEGAALFSAKRELPSADGVSRMRASFSRKAASFILFTIKENYYALK